MFSYLNGMRPSNRRSAFGTVAGPQQEASSRRYHEGPLPSPDLSFDRVPSRSPVDGNAHEPLPVSAAPPILPPIPRVASRLESHREADSDDAREWESIRSNAQPPLRPPCPPSRSVVDDNGYIDSVAEGPATDHQQRTLESMGLQRPSISLEQYRHMPHQQSPPKNVARESMWSYSEPQIAAKSRTRTPEFSDIPQPQRQAPAPPLPLYIPLQFSSQPPPPTLLQPPSLKVTQSEVSSTNVYTARHGKAKLNLRNPLSLLAKRRSSQVLVEAPSERYTQNKSPLPPGMRLPDDYDPRIRGKVVHDFSAPRPRSKASKQEETPGFMPPKLSTNSSTSLIEDDSPVSIEKEHAPVFKEHFEDDVEPWKAGHDAPTKRRTSAFLYQVSLTQSQPDPDPSSLPPFARNLPSTVSTQPTAARRTPSPHRKAPSPPRMPLEVVSEVYGKKISDLQRPTTSSPPTSPPVVRKQSTSNSDSSFHPAGLPRHLKSNASRFSFDLAGVGSSAQEKLLEEKHRQKARQKARTSNTSGVSSCNNLEIGDEDGDGYDDYDDMDDGGGFEEPIPGVNADADPTANSLSMHTLDGFEFMSPTKSSFTGHASPISTELTSPDTPRDSQGQVVGFAFSKPSPNLGVQAGFASVQGSFELNNEPCPQNHLDTVDGGIHAYPFNGITESNLPNLTQNQACEDDDLYFDDGMIEELNNTDGGTFDESVFDDETNKIYGLPLRDQKPLGASNQALAEGKRNCSTQEHSSKQAGLPPAPLRGMPELDFSRLKSRNSVLDQPQRPGPAFSQTAGLTQDNLLAYHDALAFAANQAALNGHFARRQDDLDSSRGKIAGDGRVNGEIDGLPGNGANDDTDDFDYDDALADDPIIAAANAEALENDDDGFYGQEFGFFARANDFGEAQYANGGYFGPRGIEGLGRSRSGRANFQEPSLTPITERSEWSNRNSAISLAMHGYPAQIMSTPGLAQLTDMMHLDEGGDMSLSALMKLRRGAWGGSNGSLQSSSSGSPLMFLPPTFPAPNSQKSNNASPVSGRNSFAASNYSLSSSQNIGSDSSDASPSSPTITLATAQEGLALAAPFMQAERSHSPVKRSTMPLTKGGHSRNSSGAESVSYVKEMSEDGGRWVLEKRRMVEGGQVEILGREVVEGGRI